jgi:hypothetical protein
MENKSRKIVSIETSLKNFFKYFLIFTKALNKLRPKEIDLLTEILYKNHLELNNFKYDSDRWNKVFSLDSKNEYKKNLEIEDYTLQNLLSSLRKKKVIKNNEVMDYYLPKISNNNFQLIYNFNIKK